MMLMMLVRWRSALTCLGLLLLGLSGPAGATAPPNTVQLCGKIACERVELPDLGSPPAYADGKNVVPHARAAGLVATESDYWVCAVAVGAVKAKCVRIRFSRTPDVKYRLKEGHKPGTYYVGADVDTLPQFLDSYKRLLPLFEASFHRSREHLATMMWSDRPRQLRAGRSDTAQFSASEPCEYCDESHEPQNANSGSANTLEPVTVTGNSTGPSTSPASNFGPTDTVSANPGFGTPSGPEDAPPEPNEKCKQNCMDINAVAAKKCSRIPARSISGKIMRVVCYEKANNEMAECLTKTCR